MQTIPYDKDYDTFINELLLKVSMILRIPLYVYTTSGKLIRNPMCPFIGGIQGNKAKVLGNRQQPKKTLPMILPRQLKLSIRDGEGKGC